MNLEKKVLKRLMEKAQNDYYSLCIIPKRTFDIKITKYRERRTLISEQLPALKSYVNKLQKMRRII